MRFRSLLHIIFIFGFIACKEKPAPQFPVLEEKKVPITRSENYEKNNLIEQLWIEVRKNKLEARDIEIDAKELDKLLIDSLESWNHFLQKNNEYYSLVPTYLGKIKDSSTKLYWQQYFDSVKVDFNNRVDSLTKLSNQIQTQKVELNDMIVQMKLKYTHDMLKEYQRIQLPDSMPLQRIASLQDSLNRYYKQLLMQDTLQAFQ